MWLEQNPNLEHKIFSELGIVAAERLDGGLVNSVYFVKLENNTTGVLRITNNTTEKWICAKERAVLEEFKEYDFFPRITTYGSIENLNVNFNITNFIEGDNMEITYKQATPQALYKLGVVLARIHQNKTNKFGFIYNFQEGATADPRIHNSYPGPFENEFDQLFIPATGWTEHLISKGSRFSKELIPILNKMRSMQHLFKDGECTYVHGDYQFKNILIKSDCLQGIVDFECFHFGDPSSDIHAFLQNCTDKPISQSLIKSFFKGYCSVRPIPEKFIEKGPFYRYHKAILNALVIPTALRRKSANQVEPYKAEVENLLKNLNNGTDPYLDEKKLRMISTL